MVCLQESIRVYRLKKSQYGQSEPALNEFPNKLPALGSHKLIHTTMSPLRGSVPPYEQELLRRLLSGGETGAI